MQYRKGQRRGVPECPALAAEAADILAAFLDLSSSRGAGMSGPLRLSVTEIRDWLDLNNISMRRDHWARCLRRLDRAWMEWATEQHDR